MRKCYPVLEGNLSPLDPILGTLYQEHLIDKDQMQEIRRTLNPKDQVWKILDNILPTRSIEQLETLCWILERSKMEDGIDTHGKAAEALREQIELEKNNSSSSSHRTRPTTSTLGAEEHDDSFTFTSTTKDRHGGKAHVEQKAVFSNNQMNNCQINFFGATNNSGFKMPRNPHPFPPGNGREQSQAKTHPSPPPSYQSYQSSPKPPTSLSSLPGTSTQPTDTECILDFSPNAHDLNIHIIPLVNGHLGDFCHIIGVDHHERDGRGRGVAESIKAEQPNLTWTQLLDALRRMGLEREANTLQQKLLARQL